MNILTTTADGSNTLFNPTIGEHYHSAHGALQEARHVFVNAGLRHWLQSVGDNTIKILEVGFGTGLNFILTLDYCTQQQQQLVYTGIEAFPLDIETTQTTGYQNYVTKDTWDQFIKSYPLALQNKTLIPPTAELYIAHTTLDHFQTSELQDLVYFDAFSVRHQPEMWTAEIIAHTCSFLKPGGVFVTYAITGQLKRALKACGFTIEKLPGAPGKREMLRGIKI